MSSIEPSSWIYIFMVVGPTAGAVTAFLCSLWYQNRKQRLDAKKQLFMTLIIHRQPGMRSYEAVNALNAIDVVFDDSPRIVDLWHRYFDKLCQSPVNWQAANHDYLDLLSEMARSLDYKAVSQTDIDKCYTPEGHAEFAKQNVDIQKEWLRVLQNTARFVVDKRNDENIS